MKWRWWALRTLSDAKFEDAAAASKHDSRHSTQRETKEKMSDKSQQNANAMAGMMTSPGNTALCEYEPLQKCLAENKVRRAGGLSVGEIVFSSSDS